MTKSLIGVWESESDTRRGLFIYTETHHIWLYTANNREPFSNVDEPAEAEELAAFRTMGTGAGTYSVSGSLVTTNIELSRVPNLIGNTMSVEVNIDGDRLIFKEPASGEIMDTCRKIG